MTLREYISFWQETYDKHQSRPTTYAAHNYVFKNHKAGACCTTPDLYGNGALYLLRYVQPLSLIHI